MKERYKIVIQIAVLIIIFVMVFAVVTSFLYIRDENTQRWNYFYKLEDDTVDLAFFGNSHGNYAHIPMYYDEKLEIDSYNLCTQGASVHQIYFQMKEMFKIQSPKVVIMDMYAITITEYSNTLGAHSYIKGFSGIPLSINKVQALIHSYDNESLLEYMFPMERYHLRWKEENIFEEIGKYVSGEYEYSPTNGYESGEIDKIYSSDTSRLIIEPKMITTDKIKLAEDEMQMLQKITDLCNENNAKLFIVSIPYNSQFDETYYREYSLMNELQWFFNENNISLFEFTDTYQDIGLNTACMRDGGHLNYIGATKMSDYFSSYMSANYSELFSGCTWDYEDESKEKMQNLAEAQEWFVDKYNSEINVD